MTLITPFKVGAFVLITALAGIAVLRFFDKSSSSEDGYLVYLHLRDAGGVVKRSHVLVAGIPIGHVEDIRLDGELARIDMRINPDVKLYEDATATKTTRNLLGEYFISVSPGTAGRPELGNGGQLRALGGAATPDELLQDMSKIAKTVERITEAIEHTVASEDAQNNLQATLRNIAEVTAALHQTVEENRQSVRNILEAVEVVTQSGQNDVLTILSDVKAISHELRGLLGTRPVGDATRVEGDSASRSLADRIARSSENLEKTLANLESTTARLERGEGTLGRLTKDEKLIDRIESVTNDVGDYVGGLAQLRTIMALRTDYQFRTQAVKSFVELRLQPREDKYYSVEVVNDPRGLTTLEQTNVSTTNPNEPNQYQEIRSVTTNALRFSLQFAQRFGPLVGRFGIKESTGGVGVDLLLLDDRFELRQDVFGFGEVVRPRWRLSLGYAFLDRLWLMGGVDDTLSVDRREYFTGMQLKFDDEDLKTVLPFAPSP